MKNTSSKTMLGFLIALFAIAFQAVADEALTLDPDLVITVDNNKALFENHENEVILLDFWASWCGPCRSSFPWMNEMQSKYKDQGFRVIAINLDSEKSDAEDFLKQFPANFQIAFDAQGTSAEKLEVAGMPMSYLIDREGNIREKLVGFSAKRADHHEQLLKALLTEQTLSLK